MRMFTKCIVLFAAIACSPLSLAINAHPISKEQLTHIGKKIYHNETGSNPKHLIAWNEGENFVSLGIGHFIWFPPGLDSPFTETFPDLIDYLLAHDVALPTWLENTRDLPWHSKTAFEQALSGSKMNELRELLLNTFDHQVMFIQKRKSQALPKILNELDEQQQINKVSTRFHQLANTELGLYSLIDYVNFKGEGIAASERYQGKGWGLLQVLLAMDDGNPHLAFSKACKLVLSQRVNNSPQKDVEQKWLAGWHRRCDTYKL